MTPQAIMEYRDVTDANQSRRTVIDSGMSAQFPDTKYALIHATAGYECAGSCARWTNEKYGAIYTERSGATGGQWYRTEAETRAHFERVTGK